MRKGPSAITTTRARPSVLIGISAAAVPVSSVGDGVADADVHVFEVFGIFGANGAVGDGVDVVDVGAVCVVDNDAVDAVVTTTTTTTETPTFGIRDATMLLYRWCWWCRP